MWCSASDIHDEDMLVVQMYTTSTESLHLRYAQDVQTTHEEFAEEKFSVLKQNVSVCIEELCRTIISEHKCNGFDNTGKITSCTSALNWPATKMNYIYI